METPFWPATPDSGSPTSTSVDTPREQIEPELTQLLKSKITPAIIEYLTDRVNNAVQYGLGQPSSSASQHSRRASNYANHERAKLIEFFTKVLRRAEVTMSVVLGALIYIDRAKPHLRIAIQEWAHHRVFLGAIILASKYLNDSSLKNVHWALCTGVFGRRDVARIEREFLEVLDFELGVHTEHLNLEFWNLVDARAVRCNRSHSSVGSLDLKALNLIEFGGSVKMERGNGSAEKRKLAQMGFGDDMDIAEMQRGRRERRDALELYAPAVSHHAYRAPAPSPISPLSAAADSPAYSACSSDSSANSSPSDSSDGDSNSSSPSVYSDASSNDSVLDPCTPAMHGNSNMSMHFPLPHPLSVPRVDALRIHTRSRSRSATPSKSHSLSRSATPSKSHSHSLSHIPIPTPHAKFPPPHQRQLLVPSLPLSASRSLPASRASSRSASPYASSFVNRTGSAGALALYPSCLNGNMRTSHPMIPPMASLAPPMRLVVSGAV